MRLACIYALLDQSHQIKIAHLKAALALWDYAEASARRIFGSRMGDPVADRILAAIRTTGNLTETEVHDLFNRHKTGVDIERALELLEHRGLAIRRDEHDTGGRPRTTWRITSHEK
jgi:transcription initiation factor IIE alpha subunit